MDHNIDWLGDDEHGEELNRLIEGAKYGWPFVYDRSKFHPKNEPDGGNAAWAKASREPELLYTPHAAPMQMVFYSGSQFPQEYRGDAFVAMRGSWNRRPPAGYEVVRVRFQQGKQVRFESFLSGFLVQEGSRWAHFGRPVGLAVLPDGSLLVGDDTKGVIYRVSYGG
jgi:glucose/arabinose dehydrogenase